MNCINNAVLARHRLAALGGMAALALLATACGGSNSDAGDSDRSDSGSSKPFDIVAVMSLSGPAGTAGKAQQRGLQVAVDELNASGGICGRQIKVEALDDTGDPTKAVSLIRERLSSGGTPDAAVHGTTSAVALAILPSLTRAGVLSLSFPADSRINDPKTFPYAFGATAEATVQATGLADEVLKGNPRKIAILVPDDAIGTTIGQTLKLVFEKAGTAYAFETFHPGDLDASAQVERLKSANPDVFVFSGLGASASLVLKGVDRAQLQVPLYGDVQVSTAPLAGVPQAILDRLQVNAVSVMAPDALTEDRQSFKGLVTKLKAQGPIDQAFNLYSHQYDVIQLLGMAAAQAKSCDRTALVKALENLQQPADGARPYATFVTESYSAASHFPDVKPTDFGLTPWTPLVDGRFQAK